MLALCGFQCMPHQSNEPDHGRSCFNEMHKLFIIVNYFVFWYHCKHIFVRKKNWALLIDLFKKVKNQYFTLSCSYVKRMTGKWKEWNITMKTVMLNKFYFASNWNTKKRLYSLDTQPQTSTGRFSWQLENGHGLSQIYFKNDY